MKVIVRVLNAVLLSRNLVEDQSHNREDNWTGNRPDGSLPVALEDWLNTSEDDPDDQDGFNEDNQNIRPEAVVKDFKRPLNVLLLKEWEGPNQKNVWEASRDIGHVSQDLVEALSGRATKGHGEDDDADNDGLDPHCVSGHAVLVKLSHVLRPQFRVRPFDKGLDR